jgi:small subunit ribosomal protein S16
LVKLRLNRMGRKKAPIYKIVAADSRSKRDGRFIEAVGQYDPSFKPAKIELKEDRALYWLKSGAQPTVTVKNLLSSKGVMLKHHLMKKGADETKIAAELHTWQLKQEAKLAKHADKKLKLKDKKKKAAEKPAEEKPAAPVAEKPAEEQPVVETPVAEAPVAEAPAEKPAE